MYAFTSQFGTTQLKTRIRMLNKPASPKANKLKYLFFLVAVLVVASASTRHRLQQLSDQLPVASTPRLPPDSETPESRKELAEQPGLIISTAVAATKAEKPAVPVAPATPASAPADPANRLVAADTGRVSPSRYMAYEGDFLYWIITPKTTLDDFAVMKKEFEKHGNAMQLNELKYDPLYAFICRISFSVKRPFGGLDNCRETETNNDTKPIQTKAGYVGVGSKTNYSSAGNMQQYKSEFPEKLRAVAASDESNIDQFIAAHKPDYLMLEGEQKFKDLGSGGPSYARDYIRKNPTQNNSGLLVNPDGSLAVNKELGNVRVFIDNEAIGRAALSELNVNKLFSVVQAVQYNPARKESFIAALLIYTTENN